MPRATCIGTSERENKERNNKTKQIVGNKIVLRQHAPQRSTVVVRVQPSNKVKSQTLRLWPLPTQRSSTDSSSMPHLSAELLILPLLTPHSSFSRSSLLTPHSPSPRSSLLILPLLTSRATRRQRHVPGSRPPFLLDSADFRSIPPLVRLVHCAICNRRVVLSLPIQFQTHTRLKTSVPQLIHNVQLKHKTTTTTGLGTQAKHRL